MRPSHLATALACAIAAGPVSGAEPPAPGAPLPAATPTPEVPADLREALADADRAEAGNDLAAAYARLREVRNHPGCPSGLGAVLDQRRNLIARRLAGELAKQAAEQEHDRRPEFAEKFRLQALSYRAAAAADLERFYDAPGTVQALGGADEVRARRQRLDDDQESAEGLRWNLQRWNDAAPAPGWSALDHQLVRLDRLVALAGAADDDVVAWTRRAVQDGLALGRTAAGDPAGVAGRLHLVALAHRVLPDGDPLVGQLDDATAAVRHHDQLLRLGPVEQALTVRISAWQAKLSGRFTATTTPSSTAGGFATDSAGASPGASGTGSRIDVGWLREPGPTVADTGLVYGVLLVATNAHYTTDLALSDPDTGAASLRGRPFASNLALGSIGLDLTAGARFALGDRGDGEWSLQLRGFAGLHRLHLSYGTRRGAVDRNDVEQTVDLGGSLVELGGEAELAWRWATNWALVAGLGLDYARLHVGGNGEDGTFTNSAGNAETPGSYDEAFTGLRMMGPFLGVGLRAAF